MLEKSPVAYALMIDEERDDVLSIMTSFIANQDLPAFMSWLKKEGREQVFIDMIKEKSDRQHERGWCKADDCEEPNQNKI